MRLRPFITLGTTALALAAGGSAVAAGNMTLQGRESVSQITLSAGFGISGVGFPCTDEMVDECLVTGNNGSLDVVTDLASPTILLQGTGTGFDTDLVFSTSFDADWAQSQTFSLTQSGADAVLKGSGQVVVNMASIGSNGINPPVTPAVQGFASVNWQTLYFSLDQATSFQMSGGSVGGQKLEFSRWTGDSWQLLQNESFPTVFESFDYGGSFQAGDYRLRNLQLTFGNSLSGLNNRWDYTLTLADTVAAVPEPGTAALWLAALAMAGVPALRRRAWPRA
jgi:hypothetical protein